MTPRTPGTDTPKDAAPTPHRNTLDQIREMESEGQAQGPAPSPPPVTDQDIDIAGTEADGKK